MLILCFCAFLDGWSTVQFLHRTFLSENNPLFGKHPSDLRVWGEGTLLIGAEIALAWWLSRRRSWMGWVCATAFLSQAAWQLHLYFSNAQSYEHIHHYWH